MDYVQFQLLELLEEVKKGARVRFLKEMDQRTLEKVNYLMEAGIENHSDLAEIKKLAIKRQQE